MPDEIWSQRNSGTVPVETTHSHNTSEQPCAWLGESIQRSSRWLGHKSVQEQNSLYTDSSASVNICYQMNE